MLPEGSSGSGFIYTHAVYLASTKPFAVRYTAFCRRYLSDQIASSATQLPITDGIRYGSEIISTLHFASFADCHSNCAVSQWLRLICITFTVIYRALLGHRLFERRTLWAISEVVPMPLILHSCTLELYGHPLRISCTVYIYLVPRSFVPDVQTPGIRSISPIVEKHAVSILTTRLLLCQSATSCRKHPPVA